jgi:hypothetical protein
MILEVVDLKFELLSRDGKTCSKSHDSIPIEWVEPNTSTEREDDGNLEWMERQE